jgi:hypothetical protein
VSDPATRRAARVAALVAVPAALVAGIVAYRTLDTGGPGTGSAGGASPRPRSTAPVDMPAPPLAERPAAVCRDLFAKLPERLGDLARRPVTAGPAQNAAYGDPPVTVACGVSGPAAPPGAQFFRVNGVCWYPEPKPGAATWTLRGREVPVLVTVPTEHTGQYLADLAAAVSAAVAPISPAAPCG